MLKAYQTVGTGLRTVRQYASSKEGNLSANFSGCCLRRGTFRERQEKYPKEADSREALTVKSIALASVSLPVTPISSRPPLRIPPGRCASVECSLFYFLLSNYNFSFGRVQKRARCKTCPFDLCGGSGFLFESISHFRAGPHHFAPESSEAQPHPPGRSHCSGRRRCQRPDR